MVSLYSRLDGLGWVGKDFRLSERQLDYSEGVIELQDVERVSRLSEREFSVVVPGRDFLIRARDAEECTQWIEGIRENFLRLCGSELPPVVSLTEDRGNAGGKSERASGKANLAGMNKNPMLSYGGVAARGADKDAAAQMAESLELSPSAKDYLLRSGIVSGCLVDAVELLAKEGALCDGAASSQIQFLTKFLAQKAERELIEERENNIDDQRTAPEYDDDNWKWYIFTAERRVDATKIPKIEIPNTASMRDIFKFTSFLPHAILDAINEGRIVNNQIDMTPGKPMMNPVVNTRSACLVFIDASGFTAMTEKLAKQTRGAEELGGFLNTFFGKLIDIVDGWGGDIIKFSGDAVTVLFPADTEESALHAPIQAACCCQTIHEKLSYYPTPAEGVFFSFHIGVGYGECTLMQVGGVLGRFEYCATGPAFPQIAIAEPIAVSTQTCGSPEFLVQFDKSLKILGAKESAPRAATSTPGYMIMGKMTDMDRFRPKHAYEPNPDFDVSMLSRYIPMSEFRAILADERMDAEMRKISVIFLSIASDRLDCNTEAGVLKTQMLMTCCQRSCYALEGSVNKFVVDDKGMLLLCCFGLKPLSHFGDDPVRATLAAMRMLDTLSDEGCKGQVGVSTGVVWCGVLGTSRRKEYTVLGDVVNLSARLMGNAGEMGILCDEETARCLQRNRFEVLELDPVKMKGKANPVPVFKPTGRLFKERLAVQATHVRERRSSRLSQTSANESLYGASQKNPNASCADFWLNSTQYQQLEKVVESQLDQGGGVVCVTGDPGTGKHEILEPLRHLSRHDPPFLLLEGNALNPTRSHMVSFLPWQSIFNQLGEAIRTDLVLIEEIKQKTGKRCNSMTDIISGMIDEELVTWLPLLSKVMCSVEFGDTIVKAQTDCDLRHSERNRLMDVCLGILDAYSQRRKIVLLLHLQRSAAFFEDQDKRTGEFSIGLTKYILERKRRAKVRNHGGGYDPSARANQSIAGDGMLGIGGDNNQGALVFVMCSRPLQTKWFEFVKEKAFCIGALIEMTYFDVHKSAEYFKHCLTYWTQKDCSGARLSDETTEYIMDMTVGNAYLLNILADHFVRNNFVQNNKHAALEDEPKILVKPSQNLHDIEVDGILGIAFTHFDRLSFAEQKVLKLSAALEMTTWTCEDLVAVQTSHLRKDRITGLPEGPAEVDAWQDMYDQTEDCLQRLVKKALLRQVERDELEKRGIMISEDDEELNVVAAAENNMGMQDGEGHKTMQTRDEAGGSLVLPDSLRYEFSAKFYRLAAEKQVLYAQRMSTQVAHKTHKSRTASFRKKQSTLANAQINNAISRNISNMNAIQESLEVGRDTKATDH
ncbi:unnamed protein product [Amoebophrya sp. A25]|nr:unnamed protein product [Amoebophrya sp. A25]|eukprot:GSA25T00005294001.1